MADRRTAIGNRRRLSLKRASFAGAIIAVALIIGGIVLWRELHRPLKVTKPVTVEIHSGQQFSDVVKMLENGHLVNDRFQAIAFDLAGRLGGQARHVKAGQYQLRPGETPSQFLQQILSGKVASHTLTLVDGWRFRQAWQAIENDSDIAHTLPRQASDALIMAAIGHPLVAAEGHFYPDTYRFPKGETDITFLRRAYAEMQSRLQAIWTGRIRHLPLKTPDQALILASLIEKETADPPERPKIAGVFIRRLEIGMRLQSDPSVIYGLGRLYKGKLHTWELRLNTPYNTYIHYGLPPTPICLPSEGALEAAVHPDSGKALYFVSKGNGTHAFADTLKQQDANVRRYELDR